MQRVGLGRPIPTLGELAQNGGDGGIIDPGRVFQAGDEAAFLILYHLFDMHGKTCLLYTSRCV